MKTSLLETALDEMNLLAAWEKVRDNAGMAGTDGQSVDAFSMNVFGRLLTLKYQVARGEYRPRPLKEILIPKSSGGQRRLAVPTVQDRVLQTAVVRVLTPILDKTFEKASYGYRVGHSVQMAVARVAHYRDQGFQWVVDADIQTYFDQVDHTLLMEKLRRTLEEYSLLPLIGLWLAATIEPPGTDLQPYLLVRGIPQGSPLSPLLANLYLDDFDEAIIDSGARLVRFADDFLILCQRREEAKKAMEQAQRVLKGLKLRFQPKKTRITHFDEGFQFLGVEFVRNLMRPVDPTTATSVLPPQPEISPDPLPDRPVERREPGPDELAEREPDDEEATVYLEENPALEPLLRTLVVTSHGKTLLREGRRLSVAKKGRVEVSIPFGNLDQVWVSGNQLISTALFKAANEQGVSFAFADAAGRHVSSVIGSAAPNLQLWREQVRREQDDPFVLMMVRAILQSKLHNSRAVLRRYNRRRQLPLIEQTISYIEQLSGHLAVRKKLDQLRGFEGAAAKAYFRALGALLPEKWGFSGRQRQPPVDPFNVLLSYGYGVLFATIRTLTERRGLNPWFGYLHATNGRHPSLVSDLMEEFRAPVVDTVALGALLHNFSAADFFQGDDPSMPCRMREQARKRYVEWIQNKFRSVLIHPRTGQRIDYHRLIQGQVHHCADVILGKQPVYTGYHIR